MSRDSSYSTEEESLAGPDDGDDDGATRRRVLAGGAASWATVALAGCPGGDTETDTPEPAQDTDTDTETPTDTPTATPEPEPENYVVTAETGTGSVPEGAAFASACSATRRFVPGMMVVWYVGIYDPETGDQLTDEDLESVVINVDGGPEVELGWAGDDEENPAQEWGGSWTLPGDISTGTYAYTVEVQVADDEANFRTVGILEDAFEVIEYTDPSNYVVYTETRWNGHPAPEYTNGFVGTCAPEREFTSEMDVTFVVGIYDSTTGNMVGAEGLVDTDTKELVEGTEGEGLDSVTAVSPDGAFSDLSLEWTAARDDENGRPRWYGTLETETLEPGTYPYEIQVSNENRDRFDVNIASAQFSIIEVPESQ